MDVTDLAEYQATLKLWRESAFAYPATGLKGSGAEVALDQDVLSFLGLDLGGASGASESAAGVPAPQDSQRAASLLGLGAEDAAEIAGDLDTMYELGDCYRCKCGWPRLGELLAVQGKSRCQLAVKHWRESQGTIPPKVTKAAHSHISNWYANSPAIRENKRRRFFLRHLQWKSKLPVRIQHAVCDFDSETVSIMTGASQNANQYRCRRCGKDSPRA